MPKEIEGVTYYTKDEIYMDQSQVDKVIQDRLARVEKKPEDYDQIKSRNQELEQEKTQLEGALAQKDEDLTQAIETAKQEQREQLLPEITKERIKTAALTRGFRKPEDALTFFGEIPLELDDDGIVNRLTEIATERDYLLASDPTPSAADVGVGVAGAGKASMEPGMPRVESALEPK